MLILTVTALLLVQYCLNRNGSVHHRHTVYDYLLSNILAVNFHKIKKTKKQNLILATLWLTTLSAAPPLKMFIE